MDKEEQQSYLQFLCRDATKLEMAVSKLTVIAISQVALVFA